MQPLSQGGRLGTLGRVELDAGAISGCHTGGRGVVGCGGVLQDSAVIRPGWVDGRQPHRGPKGSSAVVGVSKTKVFFLND